MQQVIVTFSTAPDEVMLRLFRRCEEMGVTVAFVPRLFEKVTARLTVDYLGALPLLAARTPNPRGLQFAVKYTVDRLLAAGLLLLAAPFLISPRWGFGPPSDARSCSGRSASGATDVSSRCSSSGRAKRRDGDDAQFEPRRTRRRAE